MNKEVEMDRTGTFEQVMSRIWELYVEKGATNVTTRRHLQKMMCFSDTQIFRIMELLQVARNV